MSTSSGSSLARGVLRVDALVWRAVDGALLLCVAGITITVALQVISRLLGASLPWTEELSRFLFLWTAFLGMAVGFRRLEHPRIALLMPLMRRLGRTLAVHVYTVTSVVFFSVAAWHSAAFVAQQIRFGERSAVLGVGMYVASLPMLIACVVAIVAVLVSAYGDPATRRRLEDEGVSVNATEAGARA